MDGQERAAAGPHLPGANDAADVSEGGIGGVTGCAWFACFFAKVRVLIAPCQRSPDRRVGPPEGP